MGVDAIITIAVIIYAVVLFASEVFSTDLVALSLIFILVATGVIDAAQLTQAFSALFR